VKGVEARLDRVDRGQVPGSTIDEKHRCAELFLDIGRNYSGRVAADQGVFLPELSGVNYSFGLTTTISPYQRQLPFSF
jgi:hypothetical protein